MKRALITGGDGALGQAVIEHLRDLKIYSVFTTRSKCNSNANKEIKAFPCDLRCPEQLTAAFDWARPDLVLHLAAKFTHGLTEAYQANVVPATHLLDLVDKRKSKTRVILIGSAAEYGAIKPEDNPISEQHPLRPVSVYGVSKAWQTQLLGLYASRDVDVICARIFNLFGPGISEKLFFGRVQNQINAIKLKQQSSIKVGALSASRDYISTKEAAHQLLTIARFGVSGNVYHVGSGRPITMRDFLIEELLRHGLSSSLIDEAEAHSNHCGHDVPMIFANMEKTRNLEGLGPVKICQSLS